MAPSKTLVNPADIDWARVTTFDDAIATLRASGIDVTPISDFGEGFILLPTKDKATLKGVDFLIIDGGIRIDAKTGREYLSFRLITRDGRKFVVNDGSVGLCAQGRRILAARHSLTNVSVMGGFTGGEYDTVDANGNPTVASTFYFSGV